MMFPYELLCTILSFGVISRAYKEKRATCTICQITNGGGVCKKLLRVSSHKRQQKDRRYSKKQTRVAKPKVASLSVDICTRLFSLILINELGLTLSLRMNTCSPYVGTGVHPK